MKDENKKGLTAREKINRLLALDAWSKLFY